MPSAITRNHKNRRNTRRSMSVNRPQPTTPISMTNAVAAGSVITITFDQPVILRGTPKYTTDVAGADVGRPISSRAIRVHVRAGAVLFMPAIETQTRDR